VTVGSVHASEGPAAGRPSCWIAHIHIDGPVLFHEFAASQSIKAMGHTGYMWSAGGRASAIG
jgi:hypothetical protein